MLRSTFSLAVAATLIFAFSSRVDAQLNPDGSPDASHPSLRLWLDSSDASTLWQNTAGTIAPAGGSPIARWDSKATSNAISVQQGSAGNTPSYNAAGINSLAAVRFVGGGGGDALTSTTGNSTGITGTSADMTMISVWQSTAFTGQNYQHSVHLGDTTGNEAYGHSVSRGGNAGSPIGNHYWGSGFNTSATADTSPHLAVSTWDGTLDDDIWYVDGTPVGSNTGAPNLNIGASQLQIGSRLNPFTEGFSGDLHEVIIFDQVLSEEDRNLLGGYIETKYGITIENATFGAIPEPTSVAIWAIVGLALGGFGYLRWRKAKK